MAYEYLSAGVALQKYTKEINSNSSFFIYFGEALGKAFSLTKNGIWIALNLLSTLPGRK